MANGEIKIGFSTHGAQAAIAEIRAVSSQIKGISGATLGGIDLSGVSDALRGAEAAANDLKGSLIGISAPFDGIPPVVGEASNGVVELSGNVEDAAVATKKMSNGFNVAGAAIKATLASVVASAAAVAASIKGVSSAFDWGKDLARQSAAIGASVRDTMLLAQAFKENGAEGLRLESIVSKMQKRIAEGSDAFGRLGISVEALKGRGAVEQMSMLGEAIRGVGSQEERARAVMKLFEEQGAQLMQFFANPDALKNATATLGSSVDIMSRNAEAFARAGVLLENIGTKLKTFFAGLAEGVVAPLNSVLEALNKIDLAKQGQLFGDSIAYGVEYLMRVFRGNTIGDLLKVSFVKATSALLDGVMAIGEYLVAAVAAGMSAVSNAIGHNWDSDFFKALGDEFAKQAEDWATNEKWSAKPLEDMLIKDELRSLLGIMDGWVPPSQRDGGKTESGPAGKSDFSVSKLKDGNSIAADSLARVGGMLGGVQSPAVLASQQTAKNTAQANRYLRKIADAQAVAVFG